MKNKVLVIIPAYNEEENIISACASIQKYGYDYIVINDCSKDYTKNVCEDNNIPVINLVHNLGIGGAIQTGYKYAYENGYDIAIQFDGDCQHDASYIEDLIKPIIEYDYDYVIGSRFIENKSSFKSTKLRRVGIKMISSLIKLCTKKRITDPTSGFRAINRKVLRQFSVNYPTEYPEPISTVILLKQGHKVKEIPVEMKERDGGVSSIRSWKNIYYMMNVFLSIIIVSIRRYK